MTENFPGAAGPTPERPEQSADQAAQSQTAHQEPTRQQSAQPAAGTQGAPEQSPWAPRGQQGPQSFGGYQQTQGFEQQAPRQPGFEYLQSGQNTLNLNAAQPHGVYTAPSKPGRTKLVVGIAVLALIIGGGAGALGGYLAAQSGAGSYNALNAPVPAASASNVTPGSVTDVANKVLPTVVEIKTQEGEGSGIIVSSDGSILTNNHVIAAAAGGGQIEVDFQNGKTASAKIIGRDPTTDVAVIKAAGVTGLPTATLGTSGNLRIGQQVVAVGSPFDLAGTVTSGIVSSLHRPVDVGNELDQTPRHQQQTSQQTVLDAIQTDAAINPGNSGGPLVNMQGQVIGINSAISSPSSSQQSQGGSVGIGFAIPIDQAKRTAQQIEQSGKATQTQLGVTVTDAQSGSAGALIKSVGDDSAAQKAGLNAGDVVTKFNDRVISDANGLVAAVHAAAPGDTVTLTLTSGKTVRATLAGSPVNVQN
jgi:putative serine protease PepD